MALAFSSTAAVASSCGAEDDTKTWDCIDSVGEGTSCICAWESADFVAHTNREPSCDASFNGNNLTCCASSTVFQAYEGDFGACVCDGPCLDDELEVDDCTDPIPETHTGSSSGPGGDTCTDKGFCGPSNDDCNCGLVCIHAAVGDYLCGDPCSSDHDCIGKSDPASGDAYTTCAATEEGFCR